MLNGNQTLLNDLRDIHYPEPVSWWPPAVGWWIVALVLIVFILFTFAVLYRTWRKKTQKRRLLKELDKLRHLDQAKNEHVIAQLSIFLKRVSMTRYPREQVATLQGEAWLQFLNQTTQEPLFTGSMGKELITAPYRPTRPKYTTSLLQATEKWLQTLF